MPRARADRIIPVAPVDRLIRRAGAQRVSSSASEKLAWVLVQIGTRLTRDALKFARHAGRGTLTSADIDAAFSLWGTGGKPPEKF